MRSCNRNHYPHKSYKSVIYFLVQFLVGFGWLVKRWFWNWNLSPFTEEENRSACIVSQRMKCTARLFEYVSPNLIKRASVRVRILTLSLRIFNVKSIFKIIGRSAAQCTQIFRVSSKIEPNRNEWAKPILFIIYVIGWLQHHNTHFHLRQLTPFWWNVMNWKTPNER